MNPAIRSLLLGRASTPVQRVLDLAGLGYLSSSTTYLEYPNDSSRSSGNRHYLYKGGSWVDPTTLDTSMGAMVGTLNADGTGGSLSYTPEIVAPTTVEAISVLYTDTNVVVPILSMGFNRALTAGERTSLSSLITPIATAAGVSPASCSLVTGQEFQQRCLKMKVNTSLAGSANDTFVLPAAGSGTYAYTVDWGNGSRAYVTANTSQTKDYNQTSTFVVKCYGTYRPYFDFGGDKAKLIGLQIGSTNHTTMERAFWGCSALSTMVGYANTANVTDMRSMFNGCTVFNQSVANLNTANVTLMAYMFNNCTAFNQSVANFNTANVTDMYAMFSVCTAFNQSVANFNTAKVTDMAYMFDGCTAFNQSVANFNTAAVNDMQFMFNGCTAFNQSVANFNTANVTVMWSMFNNCTAFNQSVANFNTAAVEDMDEMFYNCTAFKQSLAAFNMASVLYVTNTLYGCDINEPGTTTNYDNTLIAWAAQNPQNSKTFTATNCKYGGNAGSGGQQARTAIATDDLWTFVDGGHI